MSISRTVTNVWKLLSVEEPFISVAERWFCMCVTDELISVSGYYTEQVLDNGRTGLLEVPTKKCEAFEEVRKQSSTK